MPSRKTPEPMNIVFPLYQGCTLLDFAGATQIFAMVPGYSVYWVAKSTDPITTTENISVVPHYAFDDPSLPEADILFVPGGGGEGVSKAMLDSATQEFLKKAIDQAQWSGSVCTGAFVIGTAGAFDGLAATTYWSVRDLLPRFPGVSLVPGYPRFHVDEDNYRFSGGGVSSSIDLALRLVELISGREAAESTQLGNQYAPGPPVNSGDPTEASPELVIRSAEAQVPGLVAPIMAAQDAVLGES